MGRRPVSSHKSFTSSCPLVKMAANGFGSCTGSFRCTHVELMLQWFEMSNGGCLSGFFRLPSRIFGKVSTLTWEAMVLDGLLKKVARLRGWIMCSLIESVFSSAAPADLSCHLLCKSLSYGAWGLLTLLYCRWRSGSSSLRFYHAVFKVIV